MRCKAFHIDSLGAPTSAFRLHSAEHLPHGPSPSFPFGFTFQHFSISAVPPWLLAIGYFAQGVVRTQTPAVFATDFNITSPGFFYAINGNQPNPTLTLVRGQTCTFAVNSSSIHPFEILSPGVVNNNISQGTITYTVPNVASNYSYICSIHFFWWSDHYGPPDSSTTANDSHPELGRK